MSAQVIIGVNKLSKRVREQSVTCTSRVYVVYEYRPERFFIVTAQLKLQHHSYLFLNGLR